MFLLKFTGVGVPTAEEAAWDSEKIFEIFCGVSLFLLPSKFPILRAEAAALAEITLFASFGNALS